MSDKIFLSDIWGIFLMKKEVRTIVYDEELKIEAYSLEGIVQSFPNHFHEYYVIGLIEGGQRLLSCKNQEYKLQKGDIVIFNPGDNHSCSPIGDGLLDYRGINITREAMQKLTKEITGENELPVFYDNVICDEEIARYLRPLHELVMSGSREFEKEEELLFLVSQVFHKYGMTFDNGISRCPEEIEKACDFMEKNYDKHICLDEICLYAGLSKSTLLRAFTKNKRVTPYCYLENIRIGKARKLLEQGVLPADAALQTGFSDQSHFTNYFTRFIGVSPGVYREIFCGKEKKH